tara:strand:- start:554 stop:997 length:444 start_codon:yes stop_codon:yes gene_type:complete
VERSYHSRSVRDTAKIARAVASQVGSDGATILIYGELGAGKTEFVRGLVEALGGNGSEVNSPTFVLMQEYLVGRRVFHVDLYRLGEHEVLDFEPQIVELLETNAIVAIEWADRLRSPLKHAIKVRIDDSGEEERIITVEMTESDDSV